MRKLVIIFLGLLFTSALPAQVQFHLSDTTRQSTDRPRVIILATGGTIAGSGESATKAAYTAGEETIDQLLKAVPAIDSVANITGEQIINIGSQDMSIPVWLKLSKRINEIFAKDLADGVVITHGTDTMEETAYFLSLTVHADKPVVLVGAMRPATALSQDGNRNLLDAVTVAASPESKEVGTVVAMNELIFAARDVDKTSTTNVAAFQSRNFGPLGFVHDGEVRYYYKALPRPDKKFELGGLKELPKVPILYGYAGAQPDRVKFAIDNEADGIIYAGVGNGNFNQAVQQALAEAVKEGIVVCRSSRIGKGRVTLHNEVDDDQYGFVVADDLNPQKARILLMLALTQSHDQDEIQQLFLKD